MRNLCASSNVTFVFLDPAVHAILPPLRITHHSQLDFTPKTKSL
ncbi:MAG: hypothetical protein AB4368_03900 [Xenococcaceae cyanobacterium]